MWQFRRIGRGSPMVIFLERWWNAAMLAALPENNAETHSIR